MKEEGRLEGKSLRGEAERPLGERRALERGEVKRDLSWLAIGDVAVAIVVCLCYHSKTKTE